VRRKSHIGKDVSVFGMYFNLFIRNVHAPIDGG